MTRDQENLCITAIATSMFIVGTLLLPAQTLTVAIPPNTAFVISFEDSDMIVGFRWWCNGAIVKNFSDAEVTAGRVVGNPTVITVSVPGLPAGKHSCLVSAFNVIAEVKSDPVEIPVGNLPMKPANIKVIVKGE